MFAGSLVALVTPMESDGGLALDAFDRLLDWHVDSGTDGIVVAGTTGESATLTIEETRALVERAVKRVNGKIPVIAGSGTNSTAATIERSLQMAGAGADACLIVTPYYNKPTQEGLYQHYRAIEEKCPAPILLYNVPGRTCCDMQPQTVARLAELKGIVGVKEATAGDKRAREIRALCGADFVILSGDDQTALECMAAGADGVISVTANLAPQLVSKMCALIKDGKLNEARDIDEALSLLSRDMFVEANPIPAKWAMHRMGLIPDGLRLPLTPLATEYHAIVELAMEHADIDGVNE
ncbi:MAG: 4-hydroxy-tetrahydrodipicolinate synthase [Gammaproteobacteria bacterium]|nr:4-hydroxy-tetrahydrodipicolinate synthase [Gammaproteobacteria bacterium]